MFYLLPMAIEFYTLESLVLLEHKLSTAYRKSLHLYRDTLYDKMSLILRDYIVVASFGEARHGLVQSPVYIPEITNERRYIKERTVAGGMATQFTYESICTNLTLLFDTDGWNGGYGGKKWGKAVKALKLVKHPRLFIDHCFDLKHNGSNLFNKIDYKMVSCGDLEQLQYYLDKRLHSEPEWLIKHYVMPDGNRGTLTRYANKILGTQHKPKTLDGMAEVLAYQPLTFGTKILSAPVLSPKYRSCHACKAIFILYGDEHFCPKHLPDYYSDCGGCKQAYKLMQGASNVQEKKEQQSGTTESKSREK